jgi:predicted nucleotidyltransferase
MLAEFKAAAQETFGDRLCRMVLYGSYARGEAQDTSDVDVLLVLREVSDPLAERAKLSDVLCNLGLTYDKVLSVIAVDERDFLIRQSPLLLNVRREGVTL